MGQPRLLNTALDVWASLLDWLHWERYGCGCLLRGWRVVGLGQKLLRSAQGTAEFGDEGSVKERVPTMKSRLSRLVGIIINFPVAYLQSEDTFSELPKLFNAL